MNVRRTFDYIGMHLWYSLPRLPTSDLRDISHNLSYSLGEVRGLRFLIGFSIHSAIRDAAPGI
jgi:hypothetical protein